MRIRATEIRPLRTTARWVLRKSAYHEMPTGAEATTFGEGETHCASSVLMDGGVL
jgi:hypothetical protein